MNTTLAPTTPKRLVRPTTGKMIGGVCAGIARYLDVDPTVIRIAFALLTIFTGIVPGILAYAVLMLLLPEEGTRQASA